MPSASFRLSRRMALSSALSLSVGLPLLTGCGADSITSTSSTAEGDPDTALVEDVLGVLAATFHVVQANRRAHRGLTRPLRALERLHATHARELDGSIAGVTGNVADADETDAEALARVARAEARLERRLVRGAIDADSGALAQVLASMSVGVAQARAVL